MKWGVTASVPSGTVLKTRPDNIPESAFLPPLPPSLKSLHSAPPPLLTLCPQSPRLEVEEVLSADDDEDEDGEDDGHEEEY